MVDGPGEEGEEAESMDVGGGGALGRRRPVLQP